jgi:hypothetical protein
VEKGTSGQTLVGGPSGGPTERLLGLFAADVDAEAVRAAAEWQGLTLVPISAQIELFRPPSDRITQLNS